MLRFRGIILLVVFLILSILAISINPIKINDWERGNNDNLLGMVLGLDLRGGTHLVYSIESSTGEEPTLEDAQGVRKIIDKRVNEFGVSEANVQLLGTPPNKILVQIPSQKGDKIVFSLSGNDQNITVIKDKLEELIDTSFELNAIDGELELNSDESLSQSTIDNLKSFLSNEIEVLIKINFSPNRIENKEEGEDLEFPSSEDLESVLKKSDINYSSLENKEFGEFHLKLNNYGYGDESQREKIMLSLSELDYNLVNFQTEGNLEAFVASGGIQSAKRLIGSTAQLEFRVRECGKNKPE